MHFRPVGTGSSSPSKLYSGRYDFTNENLFFRNVRNETRMTRIKNENAPIPPPRKSLNSSRENTPKKKKNPTNHVKEFTIENFVNQVIPMI